MQLVPRPAAAEADEVADLIMFLASPRAAYISGTIVTTDGGIASRGYLVARATSVSSADDFGLVVVFLIRMSGGRTFVRP